MPLSNEQLLAQFAQLMSAQTTNLREHVASQVALVRAEVEAVDVKVDGVKTTVGKLDTDCAPVIKAYNAAMVGGGFWKWTLGIVAAIGTIAVAAIAIYTAVVAFLGWVRS